MPDRKRQGNDPKRRVAPAGTVTLETRANLDNVRYTGSAHHKSRLADYNLIPPVNPRPGKSLCDDLRTITCKEAVKLFRSGIQLEMVSSYLENGLPKFVWAVDDYGEAYEAKLGDVGFSYHGYRLYRNDPARGYIIAEWRKRNK
jgi:hypothetical protein